MTIKLNQKGVYFLEFSQKIRGYTYLPIKIGYTSKNVVGRVCNIQTGTPVLMSRALYLTSECFDDKLTPPMLEKAIHDVFCVARFRGEWFDLKFLELEHFFFPNKENKIVNTTYWKSLLRNGDEEQIEKAKIGTQTLALFWQQYEPRLIDLGRYIKTAKLTRLHH